MSHGRGKKVEKSTKQPSGNASFFMEIRKSGSTDWREISPTLASVRRSDNYALFGGQTLNRVPLIEA